MLIYEVVCGMRQDGTFDRLSQNESGTDGAIFYNAGNASVSGFATNYNNLVANVQGAMKIPSFTSKSSSCAPTISMTGDTTSVTDRNGVLSNWNFTNGNGVSFSKSGNRLTITKTGTINDAKVMKATRSIPSAANTTYNLWYMAGSSYQTTISLYSASTAAANAYFKIDPPEDPTGFLSIKKTTEDGKNLSGWQFEVYNDAECTSKYSGPYTTYANGTLSAILEACHAMTSPEPVLLGSYRGFEMTLFFDTMRREYSISLKGIAQHVTSLGTDVFGNIQRLDNLLATLPEKLELGQKELENIKVQLENAKAEVQKPFPFEDDLKAKTARLDELNILLNMDKADNDIVDGELAENQPERKEKEQER